MKLLASLLFAASLYAAVPLATDLTKNSVTVRIEKRTDVPDILGRRPELLLLHIRTTNADTARFVVTMRVLLPNGSVSLIKETVEHLPAQPGTGAASRAFAIGSFTEVLSVTVEEIPAPRVADFS